MCRAARVCEVMSGRRSRHPPGGADRLRVGAGRPPREPRPRAAASLPPGPAPRPTCPRRGAESRARGTEAGAHEGSSEATKSRCFSLVIVIKNT